MCVRAFLMGNVKLSYKDSGVDIDANTRWVERIQSAMKSTHGPEVIGQAGGFAGLFRLDRVNGHRAMKQPVLVGCADGVGTKVLLGIETGRLHGLGIDLVAMNVNDLITCGAKPLFFLDYLAVNRLDADALLQLIEGVADGCRQAGCALLGGETAEMPDLYRAGDFDLAGFSVGLVDSGRALDGSGTSVGDILIGLPSSGVHANGFSLVRKVISANGLSLKKRYDELGETLAEAALKPTRIYVQSVLAVVNGYRSRVVTAMAHITGGGLKENVARMLNAKCDAVIERGSWKAPPIFGFLQNHGVTRGEMNKVFNMGIGFVMAVRPRYANGVMKRLADAGESPVVIGDACKGNGKVKLR